MNAAAWSLLAERSRVLVHHVSLLMGVLTHPTLWEDKSAQTSIADSVETATHELLAALSAAPELAAHQRTMLRFDTTLAGWQRSEGEHDALAGRYRTAVLQQAAQVLISGLHVEQLATTECVRFDLSLGDVIGRSHAPGAPPPS